MTIRARLGFTLVEMLIAMTLMAIAFGLAMPMIGNSKSLKLQEAAKMLAADIELAQNESIAHPDDTRLIKLDTVNQRYWIATDSAPDTPITDIVLGASFLVQFGTGRASGINGVTIQSYSLGGDAVLRFDAYGTPDQTSNATIVLASGSATLTVQIAAGSGEVTIY